MIGLLLTIIIGFGIAYFSRNITPGVSITLGDYQYFNIPIYAITVGTYILGILIAYLIEIPQTIVTALQIMGLGRTVNSGNRTIEQLQNKINKLEIENSKLHGRYQSVIESRPKDENYKPNIIQNFLHRLNLR